MHREKNAGDDLNDQHQQGQRAKHVPEVEVLGREIVAEVIVVQLAGRETVVYPIQQFGAHWRIRGNFFKFSHYSSYSMKDVACGDTQEWS